MSGDYLRLEVTAADVRSGLRSNFRLCPLAKALDRQYPAMAPWGVGTIRAWPGDENDPGWVLSRAAQRFVKRFDQGLSIEVNAVEPLVFRIRKMTQKESR